MPPMPEPQVHPQPLLKATTGMFRASAMSEHVTIAGDHLYERGVEECMHAQGQLPEQPINKAARQTDRQTHRQTDAPLSSSKLRVMQGLQCSRVSPVLCRAHSS